MKFKARKSRLKNTELTFDFKVRPKTKLPKDKFGNNLTKHNKKCLKRQSPNKLSTLDNWLRKLYQSQPKRNKTAQSETETTKNTKTKAIEQSAKLFIRLERLNLSELKGNTENQNATDELSQKSTCKSQAKKKIKSEGLTYKDRSSEYTRLDNKEYKCAKCDYTHCNLISIRAHFDKEHNENVYKCTLCSFQTTQQYYFNSHVKYHSKPDMECPHCKKMIKWFSYKMHLKTHERNDKTEYKCDFCEYRSYNNANVKRHTMTLHKNPHELQTFKCDSCSYLTVLEERLKQHKKVVHSKEGVWLTCPQCEYTTRNKAHMSRHVNDLHSEKTVQCAQCSQLFSSKDNLRYHMKRKHTDLSTRKYYYCEMCPKEEQYKTTEKGNLARHILAHRTLDEIEVFACHKCPYLGKSKNALKIHLINAHLPEMHDFKCKICGYSTSTKSRYNHHVREVHGKPKSEKYKRLKTNSTKSLDKAQDVAETDFDEDTDVEIKEEVDDDLHESTKDADDDLDTSITKEQLNLTDLWNKQDLQG